MAPRIRRAGGALRLIFAGLRQALGLELRVAHRLRQHLAELSLGFRGLAREGLLPCCHGQYVGIARRELKVLDWAGRQTWSFQVSPNFKETGDRHNLSLNSHESIRTIADCEVGRSFNEAHQCACYQL
jgi:hypothetical protein